MSGRSGAHGSRTGRVAAVVLGAALGTAARAAEPTAYGRLLAHHVHPGTVDGIRSNLVDYGALHGDPDYRQAVQDLASAKPDAIADESARFAFWANAYNLLAIEAVVDRYPIASIRDAGSFLSPIWKKKVGTVGGREYALDEIEHGILRARFHEPRVHFALVCASLSCPDLRREPYDGETLDAQLADQVRAFLGNETKGLLPGAAGAAVRVSPIFKWYAGDFAAAGGIAAFITANAPPDVRARITGLTDARIEFLDYDWSLNDAARAR